jgi:hypothetical protein
LWKSITLFLLIVASRAFSLIRDLWPLMIGR